MKHGTLLAACIHGDEEVARALATRDGALRETGELGVGVLHYACGRGWTWLVGRCLDAGVDVNLASERGHRPLHHAVNVERHKHQSKDSLGVVRLLLKRGADVHLRAQRDDGTPLHRAAGRGSVEILSTLVDAGARLHARTEESGEQPLHHAAMTGETEHVRFFLERSVDVDVTDDFGATPLFAAVFCGRADNAQLLMAAGASTTPTLRKDRPWWRATEGMTMRDLAVLLRRKNVLPLLGGEDAPSPAPKVPAKRTKATKKKAATKKTTRTR